MSDGYIRLNLYKIVSYQTTFFYVFVTLRERFCIIIIFPSSIQNMLLKGFTYGTLVQKKMIKTNSSSDKCTSYIPNIGIYIFISLFRPFGFFADLTLSAGVSRFKVRPKIILLSPVRKVFFLFCSGMKRQHHDASEGRNESWYSEFVGKQGPCCFWIVGWLRECSICT